MWRGLPHPFDQAGHQDRYLRRFHPFFTGEQKFVDTAGRVEKFTRRYGRRNPRAPNSLS